MQHFIVPLAATLLWAGQPLCAADRPDLPNVVIILADDLGFGDPQCYNRLSKIPTPNIDRLATQGTRFTDAHTPSSVCSPTRYGLLTGRFCWRSRLKQSVLWPWAPPLIEPDRLTLPAMFQQRGYRTACIGKWHLGWDWPVEGGGYCTDEFSGHNTEAKRSDELSQKIDLRRALRGGPTDRGFDYYFGDDVPNFPPYCFFENNRLLGLVSVDKPEGMFGLPGPAQPGWDLSLVMPTLVQKAVAHIHDRAAAAAPPFLLYMPLTAPHTPIAPSPHFIGRSEAGWYGDFVCEVDWAVGQVLEALNRAGAEQNTLVIFTSDNGSPQRDGSAMNGPTGSVKARYGHDPSRPWRGMKADIWEAGHRVPMIVRWPGRIGSNEVSEEPVILTDWMRTFATILGYELPETAAEDSFDISPALFGQALGEPIHDHLIHHSHRGLFAIREGAWKLILGRDSGGFTRYRPPDNAPAGQLYDLDRDPGEVENVYRQQPEIVQRLTAQLQQYQEQGRTVVHSPAAGP